jgi:hypothetical protein
MSRARRDHASLGRRRLLAAPTAAIAVALAAGLVTAQAFFAAVRTNPGNTLTTTFVNPEGTPTATVTGTTVNLSWPADTLGDGTPTTYTVTRDSGAPGGTCTPPPLSTTSCQDTSVPSGTHTYKVTPTFRDWTGTAGTTTATVSSATLSLSPTTTTVAATLTGSISGFTVGNTLTFKLDGTTTLSGTTPTTVPAGGSGAVTVPLPASVTGGSHTVTASDTSGNSANVTITVTPSLTAPASTTTQSISVTVTGFKASDTVTIHAGSATGPAASPTFSTPAGAGNATATVTLPNDLPIGSQTLFAVGSLGDQASATTVLGALSATNVGGTVNKIDQGDIITITLVQALKPSSVCSSLISGTALRTTSVLVTVTDGGASNDTLTLTDSNTGDCSSGVHFGSINLGSKNWVTGGGSISFGGGPGNGSNSSAITVTGGTLTIELGKATATGGAVAGTVTGGATATWTPPTSSPFVQWSDNVNVTGSLSGLVSF